MQYLTRKKILSLLTYRSKDNLLKTHAVEINLKYTHNHETTKAKSAGDILKHNQSLEYPICRSLGRYAFYSFVSNAFSVQPYTTTLAARL